MAKKSKSHAARRQAKPAAHSTSRHSNVADFFATKLEAEWGPYDLKRALDARSQDIVVLDTRTSDAFDEEHIPQAINIPTEQLAQRLSELPKSKEVVPYCWSITCHLATRAALLLAQKGYRVHELVGGIEHWKNHEFPLVSKEKEISAIR
jgi:rhodanese-related sulfurtransferase